MLTREIMGLLALAILWVNTLLILGAASKQLATVRRRANHYRRGLAATTGDRLVRAKVVSGAGPAGALAAFEVDQIGRHAASSHPAILFHDATYRSVVYGGRVRVGDRELDLPALKEHVEVWPDPKGLADAARCPSAQTFDTCFVDAKKAKGYKRTVTVPVGVGDDIWIFARLDKDGGALSRPGSRSLLVSQQDPLAWCTSKSRLMVGILLGLSLGAALVTGVALYPPVFGTISLIGAGLALAYFLLVQPAGTRAREAMRPPHLQVLQDTWSRPVPKSGRPEVNSDRARGGA